MSICDGPAIGPGLCACWPAHATSSRLPHPPSLCLPPACAELPTRKSGTKASSAGRRESNSTKEPSSACQHRAPSLSALGAGVTSPVLQVSKLRLSKVLRNCLQVSQLGTAEPSPASSLPKALSTEPGVSLCLCCAWCPQQPLTLGPGASSHFCLPWPPERANPSLLSALRKLWHVLDPAETTQDMDTCLHLCPSPAPSHPQVSSRTCPSQWF